MSDVEIIYLTYNRLEYTQRSLPALLESDHDVDYKVFIHDNGSTDGTVKWLRSIDHPRIARITYGEINRGIAPVTNEFWRSTRATYIGKIDNDIIVPEGWMREILLRLEHAEEDRMGPVTLYHWIEDWASDVDLAKSAIATTSNGSQFLRSQHTGGNYIFHRYLLEELGPVPEDEGFKGGFTRWQWQAGNALRIGYVWPLRFFYMMPLVEAWQKELRNEADEESSAYVHAERPEAKRLLEIEFDNIEQ